MIENEDSHVECPVCHKKLKDEFALNGHLRLMKDEAHIAFREASHTKEAILPTSLSTPFVGTKLIDRLTTIVEDQEKIYGEQKKR